jgi:murein L,D-transpeptidase YafK
VNPLFLVLNLLICLVFASVSLAETLSWTPGSIIKLPENENAIVVEKSTQTLLIYTLREGDLFFELKMPCSTGEVPGIKSLDGDKKTPEGIYFLKDEHEDKYLSAIYGIKAFPTDYTNFMDRRAGKTGSAIWIHGTNKKLKPLDSNGCVALENSSIKQLANYVNLNSTPVIMVEKIDKVDKITLVKYENDISDILEQWVQAVEKGNYHEYLALYSTQYLPDMSWWNNWYELRKNTRESGSSFKIMIEGTGIYYNDQIFTVLFDYILGFKSKKIYIGKRKIFFGDKSSNYKIIGDVFQNLAPEFQKSEKPLIAVAKTIIK